jgi:hypothetical protein
MQRAWLGYFLVAFVAVAFGAPAAAAQASGEIRGRVVGPEGGPVAGAGITARSAADTTRSASGVTGRDGAFRLEVPYGAYQVRVVHLGYSPYVAAAEVTASAAAADLGTIQLATAAVALQEVTVETDRPPVVMTADRTIYRTRDMPAVQGGVATDALRSVPELDVDLEGRVALRGANPQIHLNGRPTPMQGEALQQFLQQLPANRIERIEVIPNPSARYEAEGSGGIVNIVLRSDTSLGLSGSLGLTAGTRGQTGAFGNLAYQQGRLTMFGNGTLNFQDRVGTTYDLRQNLAVEPSTFMLQEGNFGNQGRFGRGDLSAEYRLGERSTGWASISGGGFGADAEALTAFTMMDAAQEPTQRFGRSSETEFSRFNTDISTGVRHVIEEGRHEFSMEARRSGNGGDNDGLLLVQPADLAGDPLALPGELTVNDFDEDERRISLKADYERPVGDLRVQVGYQANLHTTESDQLREFFSTADLGTSTREQRNAFRYDQTFHQAYLTLQRQFGRLSAQAGLRAEQTATEFALPLTGERFENEYLSFFPNANLGYDLGGGKRLGLSYSRRIQRPWTMFLNPVDMSLDPLSRRVGNPYLRPQYTNSFGADLSWNTQRATLRFAPYVRRTSDDWGQITLADTTGALTTTWENVASVRAVGAQVSTMLRSLGRFSGNLGVGMHHEDRDASNLSADYSGTSVRWNANGNLTANIDRSLALQGMLFYNSPQVLPQGRRSSMVMSSLGVRKQLLDNRATVTLRVMDPFDIARFNIETRDRTHVQVARNSIGMRSASLNLSYNFGRRPRSVRQPQQDEQQPQQPDPMMGIPQ